MLPSVVMVVATVGFNIVAPPGAPVDKNVLNIAGTACRANIDLIH